MLSQIYKISQLTLLWLKAEGKLNWTPTDTFPKLRTSHNSLKSWNNNVSTHSWVITEFFISMSFLGVMLIRSVKALIWSTAAVFHNVVEALAQKCDGDQCSLYLLGCRLTLINVRRWCINLRTIRALFGGLYFKLCHLRCRYIVPVMNGLSLFPLCNMSAALLYIITYH